MARGLQILGALSLVLLLSLTVHGKRKKDKADKVEIELFEWEAVEAAAWEVPAEVRDESGAIMLFEKIVYDDTSGTYRESFQTIYRRILITSEEGRAQADVDAPFYSVDQEVLDIQGRTVLPGSFSMPGVTDSCIIEYVIRFHLPSRAGLWLIQKKIPLVYGELTWKFSPRSEFTKPHFVWENVTFQKSRRRQPAEDPTEYVCKVHDVPALADDPYSPSENASSATLYCFYGPDKLPTVYWSDWTLWMSKSWEQAYDKCKKAKSVASEFKDLATKEEQILAVYSWLQENLLNLSYLSKERALKVLDKKKLKDLKSLDDVIKHGYGGSWDINRVFCAMLKELGIEAGLVYAVDRTEGQFNRDVMTGLFNRALPFVAEGGDTVFYAPGEVSLEPGMTPWYSEGTTALEESPQASKVGIPYSSAERNKASSTMSLVVSEDLSVTGTLTRTLTGHGARSVRLMAYGEEEAELIRQATEKLKEEFPEAEISEVTASTEAGRPVSVNARLEFPALTEMGDRLVIKLGDYTGDASNPFTSTERLTDIEFRHAYDTEDSILVTIPDGWRVEGIPSDTAYDNRVGKCMGSFETDGNHVKSRYQFVLNAPQWKVADYSLIRGLFSARQAMTDGTLVLVAGL